MWLRRGSSIAKCGVLTATAQPWRCKFVASCSNEPACVVRAVDVPWVEVPQGLTKRPAFSQLGPPAGLGGRVKSLSSAASHGARVLLGCSLCELQPGHAMWPRHAHLATDEAIYILEGSGTLRLGEDMMSVEAGTYVQLNAGDPEKAHQLINTGSVILRYLCMDRKERADVCVYPDSGKTAALPGWAGVEGRWYSDADQRQYYDGEDGLAAKS